MTPHIAINGHLGKVGIPRKTAIDARTTRHASYEIRQRSRKRTGQNARADMAGASSYILFPGLPHGAIHGRRQGGAVEFTCDGSDEMEPASGRG